jgi:uncharacterized membrane protein
MKAENSEDEMKIAFLRFPRACNRNARWRNSRLPHRKGYPVMRSITLKAALAAMIIAVPLSGAFAANGGGGHGGGGHGGGSGAYGDFAQKRWFDGIDSFHHYRTPLGVKHYQSPYRR